MSFRDQLAKMRREYTREAAKLDEKLEAQVRKTDLQFQAVEERLRSTDLKMQAVRDEVGATVEAISSLRADHQETARQIQGRTRLLEERFSKMLGVVEEQIAFIDPEVLADLVVRVADLERRTPPAA